MQKAIQYIIQTIFKGMIIGIIIAIVLMSIEYVFGAKHQLNFKLLQDIAYYIFLGWYLPSSMERTLITSIIGFNGNPNGNDTASLLEL